MAASPHEAILDAVQLRLATLDLDGLRVERRLALEADWLANLPLPAVVLSGAGTEVSLGATTGEEQMGYSVTIRVIYRLPLQQQHESQLFKLRKRIRDALQRKPVAATFAGLIEVYALTMTPSPVVEVEAQAYQLLSSRLEFQAGTWEERP